MNSRVWPDSAWQAKVEVHVAHISDIDLPYLLPLLSQTIARCYLQTHGLLSVLVSLSMRAAYELVIC